MPAACQGEQGGLLLLPQFGTAEEWHGRHCTHLQPKVGFGHGVRPAAGRAEHSPGGVSMIWQYLFHSWMG